MSSSKREIVYLDAKLTGEGLEATCKLRATKVTSSDGTDSAYCDYEILSVSKRLPEGTYQIGVSNGETITLRYKNGSWLSAGPF
jgi:hypothetical protein